MTLELTPLPPCSFKRTHAHTFSHTRTNTSCRDNNARHCVTASSIVSPHGQRTPGNAQRTTLGTRELDHPSHKIPVRICGHSFRPIRTGEQSALVGGRNPSANSGSNYLHWDDKSARYLTNEQTYAQYIPFSYVLTDRQSCHKAAFHSGEGLTYVTSVASLFHFLTQLISMHELERVCPPKKIDAEKTERRVSIRPDTYIKR